MFDRPEATIMVATLETQRGNMSKGASPDLFVVDEYQMLEDQREVPKNEVTLL